MTRLPKAVERRLLERAGLRKPRAPRREDGLDSQLEADFLRHLEWLVSQRRIRRVGVQDLRFRIGVGAWYKPDFTVPAFTHSGLWIGDEFKEIDVRPWHELVVFEVKGRMREAANVRIKAAADRHRWARFVLCYREARTWRLVPVIP